MPDEWGDTWNDPGAGNYDYSGPSFSGGGGQPDGGWSIGGTLGGIAGSVLGMGALGPVGGVLGGKAGYAAGNAIGRSLGNMSFSGGAGGATTDRASDNGYMPLAAAAAAAKPKVGGPISNRVKGLPKNFESMSAAEKNALLQQMAQDPKLKTKKNKEFETKGTGADVFAIGVNVNTGKRVFADSDGNLFYRAEVKRDRNGRTPVDPAPTPAPPSSTPVTPPVVINAGGQTGGGSPYAPIGGTPPTPYPEGQPTPDWGYTPADMEYMTRAMGLGHLVDSNYGVEQLYFQQNRPEFELQDTGRYRKIASGGKAPTTYAGGGHVKGPGTGTSDSIPAVIDGKHPAALSNNEFVFTERAVRGFGGGDPDRGASALQVLMSFGERMAGGR